MYAVIKTGGKQYRVKEGDIVTIEKLTAEVGAKIDFDEVLMVGEGEVLSSVLLWSPALKFLAKWLSMVVVIRFVLLSFIVVNIT